MFDKFKKLVQSLGKTKDQLVGRITEILTGRKLDQSLIDEIEEALLQADVGVRATERLIEELRRLARREKAVEEPEVRAVLEREIAAILTTSSTPKQVNATKPEIWLITGVNGAGKTTSVGKLAIHFSRLGKKVMIGACDTFRAAAIDQVAIWAERSGVEMIRAQEKADPSAVAFDAAAAARARGFDLLLIDTAGRLHTKSHLMEELKKIRRVVEKASPGSPILSKLVIDGTTGQNALQQVKVFTEAVGCDGLIVTKLDGTAKGGVIIAIAEDLKVPVDFIGVGEAIDDLQPFDAASFAKALFTTEAA